MDRDTQKLWDSVKAGRTDETTPTLPLNFIDGLRRSLESGLSCEEITSCLILFTGFHESMRRMGGKSAVEKALNIVHIMKRDIDIENCFEVRTKPKGL